MWAMVSVILEEYAAMGGINHQSCKTFLGNSTRMSLALSSAIIAFEKINVGLERHLLAELDGTVGVSYVSYIELGFADSLREIGAFRDAVAALRQQMQDEQYQELPSVSQMNTHQLGIQFAKAGIVTSEKAWHDVTLMMRGQRGFYNVLDTFDSEISAIETMMHTLREKMDVAISGTTSLVDMLEQNSDGNFKGEFAWLYSAWISLQQFFLASSMFSTEAWYRFTKVGSLVDGAAGERAAA